MDRRGGGQAPPEARGRYRGPGAHGRVAEGLSAAHKSLSCFSAAAAKVCRSPQGMSLGAAAGARVRDGHGRAGARDSRETHPDRAAEARAARDTNLPAGGAQGG